MYLHGTSLAFHSNVISNSTWTSTGCIYRHWTLVRSQPETQSSQHCMIKLLFSCASGFMKISWYSNCSKRITFFPPNIHVGLHHASCCASAMKINLVPQREGCVQILSMNLLGKNYINLIDQKGVTKGWNILQRHMLMLLHQPLRPAALPERSIKLFRW